MAGYRRGLVGGCHGLPAWRVFGVREPKEEDLAAVQVEQPPKDMDNSAMVEKGQLFVVHPHESIANLIETNEHKGKGIGVRSVLYTFSEGGLWFGAFGELRNVDALLALVPLVGLRV